MNSFYVYQDGFPSNTSENFENIGYGTQSKFLLIQTFERLFGRILIIMIIQ